MASPVLRTYWDDGVHRARYWNPAYLERTKELGIIIQGVYNGDDEEAVHILSEVMLQHDQLPALYKAKFHTYFSAWEGEDSHNRLIIASSWIQEAKAQQAKLGVINEEIENWEQIIVNEFAALDPSPSSPKQLELKKLPFRPPQKMATGGQLLLEALDGIQGFQSGEATPAVHTHHHQYEHEHLHQDQDQDHHDYGLSEAEEKTKLQEEEQAKLQEEERKRAFRKKWHETKATTDKETAERVQKLAKLSTSLRMRISSASFGKDTGSIGALRAPRHQPVYSQRDLRILPIL